MALSASRCRKVKPAVGADQQSLFHILSASWACPLALVRHHPYHAENDVDKRPEEDDESYTDSRADCFGTFAHIGVLVLRTGIFRCRVDAGDYPDDEQNLHRENDPGEWAPGRHGGPLSLGIGCQLKYIAMPMDAVPNSARLQPG